MPADYVLPDEPVRLSAVTRRKTMKRKDEDNHALATSRQMGECRYMDWTRKFDGSLSRNNYGLVFVVAKTWLLRVHPGEVAP